MSEEKQIEEMAEVIIKTKNDVKVWERLKTDEDIAKSLYNAGYRRQREGEWIFHNDGSGTCNQCNTTQKHIWDMDNYQFYCGHCGAKMKGGAE